MLSLMGSERVAQGRPLSQIEDLVKTPTSFRFSLKQNAVRRQP